MVSLYTAATPETACQGDYVAGLGCVQYSHPGDLAPGASTPSESFQRTYQWGLSNGVPPEFLFPFLLHESGGADPTAEGDFGTPGGAIVTQAGGREGVYNSFGPAQIFLPAHPAFTQATAENIQNVLAEMGPRWKAAYQQYASQLAANPAAAERSFYTAAQGADPDPAGTVNWGALLSESQSIESAIKQPGTGQNLPPYTGAGVPIDSGPGGNVEQLGSKQGGASVLDPTSWVNAIFSGILSRYAQPFETIGVFIVGSVLIIGGFIYLSGQSGTVVNVATTAAKNAAAA